MSVVGGMMLPMTTGKHDKDRHQLDAWQIMLFAIVATFLVVTIAFASWWDAGVPVSEFPAWLEAWATVAAVAAAIVAGFYASRAFSLELDRQERTDTDRRSAQASRVAAWPQELAIDFEEEEDENGFEIPVPVAVRGAQIRVRNASDLPVAQVRLSISVILKESHHRREVDLGERTLAHLDPETTHDVFVHADNPDRLKPALDDDAPEIRVHLQFNDAVGRSWARRTHEGDLRDNGTRADRTIVVPAPSRWERWKLQRSSRRAS